MVKYIHDDALTPNLPTALIVPQYKIAREGETIVGAPIKGSWMTYYLPLVQGGLSCVLMLSIIALSISQAWPLIITLTMGAAMPMIMFMATRRYYRKQVFLGKYAPSTLPWSHFCADPDHKNLMIWNLEDDLRVEFKDIRGIDLCHQKGGMGYELNLTYEDNEGSTPSQRLTLITGYDAGYLKSWANQLHDMIALDNNTLQCQTNSAYLDLK